MYDKMKEDLPSAQDYLHISEIYWIRLMYENGNTHSTLPMGAVSTSDCSVRMASSRAHGFQYWVVNDLKNLTVLDLCTGPMYCTCHLSETGSTATHSLPRTRYGVMYIRSIRNHCQSPFRNPADLLTTEYWHRLVHSPPVSKIPRNSSYCMYLRYFSVIPRYIRYLPI